MLSVEEYLATVLGLAEGVSLGSETVLLPAALGRVLAADVMARLAVPLFDNSAMDGFAVRAADVVEVPVHLAVLGESAAAGGPIPSVTPGGAVRVMTGGRLPSGADAVVPVEDTDQPAGAAPLPDRVRIDRVVHVGQHVRRRADDVAECALVLSAGELVTPAALAAAVGVGHGVLPVVRRPRVAVLATGAELVAPGTDPAAGEIPDSNSVMLAALAAAAGAEVVAATRSGDDPAELSAVIAGLPAVDLILTSGGVSAGVYEPLRQLDAELEFSAVAMQPGKPQGHGRVGGVPLLAFPGNPVSAFVSFRVFGRPLLDALTGVRRSDRIRTVRAGVDWRTPPGRRQYLPVTLAETPDGTVARPSHRHGSGSHLIASLHLADALAVVPAERDAVTAGERVTVMEV